MNEPWTEYDPEERMESADREVLAMILWPLVAIFLGAVGYFVGRGLGWW